MLQTIAEILFNKTLEEILKCKNHPIIAAIRNANNNSPFCFIELGVEEVYNEKRKLNPRKSTYHKNLYISIHFKKLK